LDLGGVIAYRPNSLHIEARGSISDWQRRVIMEEAIWGEDRLVLLDYQKQRRMGTLSSHVLDITTIKQASVCTYSQLDIPRWSKDAFIQQRQQ